jgi:hypothetical protein
MSNLSQANQNSSNFSTATGTTKFRCADGGNTEFPIAADSALGISTPTTVAVAARHFIIHNHCHPESTSPQVCYTLVFWQSSEISL